MENAAFASSSVGAPVPARTGGRSGNRARAKCFRALLITSAALAIPRVSAAAPADDACGAPAAALQLRSAGNLSAARARLSACLSGGCPSELQECARQLAEIEAEQPSIVVEARDEANDYVTGARVTMDGAPLLERLEGKAVAVNPGEHRLVVDAPGFRKAETSFVVHEGQKRLRLVVMLNSAPIPSPTPAPASLTASVAPIPPRRRDERQTLSAGKRVGLALGGVGIAGLAVGTIFSLVSKSTYDHALESECGGDSNRCTPQGIADGGMAHNQASVATLGLAAGATLLFAGALLYFASPANDSVAVGPAVDTKSAGLAVVGKW